MSGGLSDGAIAQLDSLSLGFRDRFLNYDELTRQVRAWTDAFPQLCRASSIGRTPEGREMWLLTLGPDPDRARPSAWVDGNMHASELAGSSVALSIAEDVLRLHLADGDAPAGAGPSAVAAARVRDVRFYVLPRMSPDGAEAVLTNGRYVRSVPRDERPARAHAYWRCDDVDGDGLALTMRVRDTGGEMVESPEFPGLLLPRTIDDPPPYYKVYPEGLIENFDGSNVPTPHFLSDNQTDLNRNFPFSWAPDSKQEGAGAFPLSEVESRAVVEFAIAHPEIFLWLNLHTFGGVFIRPLGDKPDTKMNPEDLALYRQLGAWAEELTGYPMVSGCEEFLYEPDTPLYGDLTDFAYHQRGAIAYVVELWDLFKQVRLRAQEALRRQLHAVDARGHAAHRGLGPRQEREPRGASVARVRASAAGRCRGRRHRSAHRAVESAARRVARGLLSAGGALSARGGARAGSRGGVGRDRKPVA